MEKIGDVLREKVLILEDMSLQRTLTADTLARAGYATVEVETTARAFALIGAESPDLIILDSRTPEMEGARVCQRLKGNPFTNHIPILLFSNQRLAEQVTALETGADDYLGKPFSPVELLAHVKALLSQSVQYDPITKLPSSSYLHKQIDTRLSQNQPTAVAYLDIDHFRPDKY